MADGINIEDREWMEELIDQILSIDSWYAHELEKLRKEKNEKTDNNVQSVR